MSADVAAKMGPVDPLTTSSAKWHADRCAPFVCGPAARRGGSSTSHSSGTLSGQRGANGQPRMSPTIDGGEPGIGRRRSVPSWSRRGSEPSSPTVYGIAGR